MRYWMSVADLPLTDSHVFWPPSSARGQKISSSHARCSGRIIAGDAPGIKNHYIVPQQQSTAPVPDVADIATPTRDSSRKTLAFNGCARSPWGLRRRLSSLPDSAGKSSLVIEMSFWDWLLSGTLNLRQPQCAANSWSRSKRHSNPINSNHVSKHTPHNLFFRLGNIGAYRIGLKSWGERRLMRGRNQVVGGPTSSMSSAERLASGSKAVRWIFWITTTSYCVHRCPYCFFFFDRLKLSA